MYPFERFSEDARTALKRAQDDAAAARQRYIGTEHIALALASDDGPAGRVLRDLGITYDRLKVQVGAVHDGAEKPPGQIIPTSRVKRVIELAFQEATVAGVERVGTEHLLVALLVEAEGVAARALNELGATLPKVRAAIRARLEEPAGAPGRAVDDVRWPGPSGWISGSLGVALMQAGQLAREEGLSDIRADHLIRAIAGSDASDLRAVLDKLGLEPQTVVRALEVPAEIRRLGLAAQRARVDRGPDFAAGGEAAVRAEEEVLRLGHEYHEAVSRWLGEGKTQ